MTGRDALRGKVQTVTGVIEPDALGPTLMHEHLLCDITSPKLLGRNVPAPPITLENSYDIMYGRVEHGAKYRLDDQAIISDEVRRMRDAGGRSIVELSCGGLKPNPIGLRAVAQATGAHIVMGCGYYVEDYLSPDNRDKSVEDFCREMMGQIFAGAWGTDVRAGIIGEIGCTHPWTAMEQRVMQAALLAQAESGLCLNVHPGRHPDQPQQIADFVAARGGDLSRTVISHIDRTIFDEKRLFRLADTGCIIELDLFGQETTYYKLSNIDMPNDGARLRQIRSLIARGHLDQIVISHDICYITRLTKFGGHGYSHIFKNVLPLMRTRDFDEDEIDTIMVRTPRRLLTVA